MGPLLKVPLLILLWMTLYLATSHINYVVSVNPGFQVRITEKGLKYASSSAISALSKKLSGEKIPDQSGKSGSVSYSVSGMVITSFTKPTSNIVIVPGSGLKWSVNGAGISLKGNWRYKFKKGWVKISDHGSFDASVDGVSFSLTMMIGKDGTGRPKISASACSCGIGGVHIKFHGGASWIYNLFSGTIENKLKDIMKSKMCSLAVDAVNTDGEKELQKIPINVELAKKFLLDYSLISSPTYSTTEMQSFHKGEIYWKGDTTECPFKPNSIPTIKDSSKMVYLWLSDYMGNSMGYAANKHGYLKYNLTASELPAGNRSILNTTCSGFLCIGKLIPQIGQKYPNQIVKVNMVATGAPKMIISPKSIHANASGILDMYAQKKRAPDVFLIRLNMTLGIDLKVSLKDEILYTQVSNPLLTIGVVKSDVGPVLGPVIESIVKIGINLVVLPDLNKIGAKGLSLPFPKVIKFQNSELILQQNSLMVATDISYTPPAVPNIAHAVPEFSTKTSSTMEDVKTIKYISEKKLEQPNLDPEDLLNSVQEVPQKLKQNLKPAVHKWHKLSRKIKPHFKSIGRKIKRVFRPF